MEKQVAKVETIHQESVSPVFGIKSETDITIYADGTGDFEYYVDLDEDDYYIEGALTLEGKEVIDFDGCFDLPQEVKTALTEHGYIITW